MGMHIKRDESPIDRDVVAPPEVSRLVGTKPGGCGVCRAPVEIREQIEAALRGEGLPATTLLKDHPEWKLSPCTASRHKTGCMGLPALATGGQTHRELVCPPEHTTALIARIPWVPTDVRDLARDALLAGLAKLDLVIDLNPSAALYTARLGYIQAILLEADKAGGDPQGRLKSYSEEVKARLDSRSKREITRTVTMKETITEGNDKPVSQEVALGS